MKWRCPVQHKSVKARSVKAKQQWLRITQPEGPFHRDYRQLPDQPILNSRGQVLIQHRLSQANWPTRQRPALHRANIIHRPHKGTVVDRSYTENNLPPAGTQKGAETTTIPLRVLWLRAGAVEQPRTAGLRHRFGNEGMDIHLADVQHTNGQPLNVQPANLVPTIFDLILLECVETIEEAMLTQLSSIREVSQAPLIVLTDNYTLDWSLRALRAGADAIFTLNTPDDVIIARSNALLRRWA